MLMNFPNCQAAGCTTITVATGASNFSVIPALKGQIGVALWVGTTGIELSGAGVSYGPAGGFTVFQGVTTALNFMNSNGSSVMLVGNGFGLPVFNTISEPMAFAGAPQLWLNASAVSLACRITYFFNDSFLNT